MNIRELTGGVLLVGLSTIVGLGLTEGGARLFLNAADYLSIEVVEDPVLGGVVPPNRSGYDEWGFRNEGVPNSVDIVALGDSHTYGNTAKMIEAWPRVVGRATGRTVYNLGLGGYGPNQYYYLFKTRALTLNPRVILCGIYFGDDFDNAFRMTYGLDYWSFLRTMTVKDVDANIWEDPDSPNLHTSWQKHLRVWLSRHSVVYQLMFHGPLAAQFLGSAQIENAARLNEAATTLRIADIDVAEAFVPSAVLRGLDQSQESVREGMRITIKLLAEMNEMARQRDIQFVVIVIPTKESVFSELLEKQPGLRHADLIHRLFENERIAREKVFDFFARSDIAYIDTLPALKREVLQQLYAKSAGDMHPGKNGYRVIGEAVSNQLQNTQALR